MELRQYPRPADNSQRGIHWSAWVFHPSGSSLDWWLSELQAMNVKWVKLLDNGGGSSRVLCNRLLERDIIPIVRLYRLRPNPGHLNEEELGTVADLVAAGVRYFEVNNEPNLPLEWQEGEWQSGGSPEIVMQHWLVDAAAVIRRGGYPAFPALAQSGHDRESGSIPWYTRAFQYLDEERHAEALAIFNEGAWIAVHGAVLNHCYRDGSGLWHFEYPYDPICQKEHPGITIMEDDNSLIGYQVPVKLLQDRFGVQVPVISTEGGVFAPRGGWASWDPRYPGYNYEGHAERTVAMFEWLRDNAENYFFAMCPWLIASERMGHPTPSWTEDAWYRMDAELPVVAAVKAMGPEPAPPPVLPLEETLRHASWNKRGLAYNPDAAFVRYARQYHLGSPLTAEFDINWKGQAFRVQGFTGAILFTVVGQWDKVDSIPW